MSNNQQYGYGQHQQGPYYQGGQIPQQQPPKRKRSGGKVAAIVAGLCFLLIVGIGGCTALVFDGAIDAGTNPASSPTVVPTESEPGTPVEQPTTKPTEPVQTEKPKPAGTASQEQAVGKAEDYLNGMHFSRSGLIDQLVFEGFSKADATYAVGHITVNWNEQAAGKARDYLDGQHFSRAGLIDQLEFEGFTAKQAAYGVTKAGLK